MELDSTTYSLIFIAESFFFKAPRLGLGARRSSKVQFSSSVTSLYTKIKYNISRFENLKSLTESGGLIWGFRGQRYTVKHLQHATTSGRIDSDIYISQDSSSNLKA